MSKAVGVAVLSKALAISEWSRVLSNRLSIPLFIFVDFFPLHHGGQVPHLLGNYNVRDVFALLYHSRCSEAMCLTTFNPPSKSVSRAPLIDDDEMKLEELSKCPGWDTDRSSAQ